MTRRERLEAKAEKRREWAAKREARSEARFDNAHRELQGLTPGQPILVGHHSERGHRAHLARIETSTRKAIEHADMSEHHKSKAEGLERQLATSIFSDDDDAVEALEAKIAKLETRRDRMKAINAAWKKAGSPKLQDCTPEQWAAFEELANLTDDEKAGVRRTKAIEHYYPRPFAPYSLSNIGATIRTAKKRIEAVQRQQKRAEAAEAAGGVAIVQNGRASQVTFAEKPPWEILKALKAASFHYSGGSWFGGAEVPGEVVEYAEAVS